MGAIYHSDCPHCGKNNVQFTGMGISGNKPAYGKLPKCNVFLTCNHCKNPISLIVEYHIDLPWSNHPVDDLVIPALGVLTPDYQFRTIAMFPELKAPATPYGTPDTVSKTFIEAKDNFRRGNFQASEELCKKVLKLAVKYLKSEKETLYKSIEALEKNGTITPAMADWAHIVKTDANNTHFLEANAAQQLVQELIDFTEMFLTYVFTLPAKVDAKRQNPPAG